MSACAPARANSDKPTAVMYFSILFYWLLDLISRIIGDYFIISWRNNKKTIIDEVHTCTGNPSSVFMSLSVYPCLCRWWTLFFHYISSICICSTDNNTNTDVWVPHVVVHSHTDLLGSLAQTQWNEKLFQLACFKM
jgi:hypothetical protein